MNELFISVVTDTLYDKYLYHYTSIENVLKYILPQKTLRMGPLNKTNDPQEVYQHGFTLTSSLELDSVIWKKFFEWQRQFGEELQKDIITICFAQDVPKVDIERGFSKPRMWAQYGNNHTGVCLILNKEKMLKYIQKQYGNYYLRYGKVRYSDDITVYRRTHCAYTIDLEEINNSTIEQVVEKRLEEYVDIYYFSKHQDWQTENEYRIIMRYNDGKYANINIDGILEGIVLGTNADRNILIPINILCEKFEKKPRIAKLDYYCNMYNANEIENVNEYIRKL